MQMQDALSRLLLQESPAQTTIPAELVLMVENIQDALMSAKKIATWTRRDPGMAKVFRYIHDKAHQVEDVLKPY